MRCSTLSDFYLMLAKKTFILPLLFSVLFLSAFTVPTSIQIKATTQTEWLRLNPLRSLNQLNLFEVYLSHPATQNTSIQSWKQALKNYQSRVYLHFRQSKINLNQIDFKFIYISKLIFTQYLRVHDFVNQTK